MSFSKRPGRNTPQCYIKPLDSLKNWNNRFFWVDERVFPTVVDWRTNAPKDGMPAKGTYSIEAARALDTHRTPIQKHPEMLLCLVRISRRYYLGDEVYPTFLHDDDRGGYGLVQFDSCPKSYKDSSGVPSTIERSPLDFAHEARASDQGAAAPEMPLSEDVPATATPGAGQTEETATIDPPAASESRSSHGGKSLAAIQLGLASTVVIPEYSPMGVSDPDPLSFADAPSRHPVDVAQSSPGIAAARDPESENASSPVAVGSPGSVYQPEWGVTNGSLLDTPEACQDLVDHVAPPGYFSELRHMNNEEFLRQYNVNLAQQVAMGSQLRLRFEQEAKLLRKSVAQAFADAVSAGIAKGLNEGLRHGLEHGQAQRSLEPTEAYDPKVEAKFVAALQALKDLKYPLVDQLEGLRDAPMDVIMAALYLESDTGDDASQDIRDLQIGLADAIAANISRAEKKKRSRIVCRTHGVGSAHHARSDGVPVSTPTVVPQGLALFLVDATTQTESDGT
nr:hypothetical protein [Tanacetum cinerariifolium]GEY14574.1 hypothetical protein [Tanacetum cinerariifolium]